MDDICGHVTCTVLVLAICQKLDLSSGLKPAKPWFCTNSSSKTTWIRPQELVPPRAAPPPRSWPPKASPSRISRLHECAPYQGVQSVLSVSGQQRLWFWFTVLVHGCVVPADWLGVFMAHSEQCGANTSLKAKACSFTSGLVSEYSFTRSTATMLFSRSDVIRTIQFRDMVTWGAESDLRSQRASGQGC